MIRQNLGKKWRGSKSFASCGLKSVNGPPPFCNKIAPMPTVIRLLTSELMAAMAPWMRYSIPELTWTYLMMTCCDLAVMFHSVDLLRTLSENCRWHGRAHCPSSDGGSEMNERTDHVCYWNPKRPTRLRNPHLKETKLNGHKRKERRPIWVMLQFIPKQQSNRARS